VLIGIGAALERKLMQTVEDDARYGAFRTRYSRGFNGLISRETAAIIVYPATIAAWIFVAIPQPGTKLWHLIPVSAAAPVTVSILIALVSEIWLVSYGHGVDDYVRGTRTSLNGR
jgi:hypothetical protein